MSPLSKSQGRETCKSIAEEYDASKAKSNSRTGALTPSDGAVRHGTSKWSRGQGGRN